MNEATARLLLLASVLMPAAGAVMAGGDRARARQSALVTALFTFGIAALLALNYPAGATAFGLVDFSWFGGPSAPVDIRFSIALDGLGVWLFGLTALLVVVAVLVSWEAIEEEASRFYRLLLLLETGMLGVFVARDIVLFYVFFEFTLIPLFFLIGIWGSEERRYAAIKFFLFTLAGSVLTFLGLLAIVLWVYDASHAAGEHARLTFSIPELTRSLAGLEGDRRMPLLVQVWIFVALFAGFAVKVPLFPLHTWLPLAHVEAPAAGSVILAGVLLKVGVYGFLRFSVPMLPEATAACMPWLLGLSVAGIVYGALVALAQGDLKRLVAYSSVSHLGFCTLGVFALERVSVQGGVLQMVNHGLSTGALFALVGMLYERYHTRQIADLAGLARKLPWLAFFTVVAALSSIGLPGLNGFVGELLILLGAFHRAWAGAPPEWAASYRLVAVLATSGVVLGAWYMLWLVQRVLFGPLREPKHDASHAPVRDLSAREIMALAPIVALMLWIGLCPKFFLDRMAPTLDRLTEQAIEAADHGAGVGEERAWSVERRAWGEGRGEWGEGRGAWGVGREAEYGVRGTKYDPRNAPPPPRTTSHVRSSFFVRRTSYLVPRTSYRERRNAPSAPRPTPYALRSPPFAETGSTDPC